MKRPHNLLFVWVVGAAVALAAVATVVAQERRGDRETTRDEGTRGDSNRGDSARGDSNRGDNGRGESSRGGGDRGDRGSGRRGFERRPTTTSPAGAGASTSPTTLPAMSGSPRPSASPGPTAGTGPVLPEPYAVLVRRSIFVRDRSRLASAARESTPPPAAAPAPPPRPETTFALRGLSLVDSVGYVALVEDLTAGQTLEVKVGDRIARGRVAELSLDHLAYESEGKVTRVAMSQNLDGQVVVSTYTPPPVASASPGAAAPPGRAPTTRPVGGAAPPGPAAAPAPLTGGGDLAEQMRRRRQQETGR